MGRARKKKVILASAVVAAAVLLLLAWVPLWAVRLVERGFARIVWRVGTRQPVIALTFDDGPHPVHTPQVLDILKRHNARATFFLVGENARKYPALVVRIRAEGHEIGNHTDAMATTWLMSAEKFEKSVLRAEGTLEREPAAAGETGESEAKRIPAARSATRRKLLRPAGGLIRPAQLAWARARGYTVVLGSAYAWDPAQPPTAYIRRVIAKNLEPGAIVVLHDAGGNRANTVAALEGILEAARAKGLRCVTLSEMFGM